MDTPTLGTIITNHTVRKYLYGTYGILALAAAAAQAAFSSLHMPAPTWFHAAVAVLAFLALPFAGLAVANVPTSAKAAVAIADPAPVAAAVSTPVAVQTVTPVVTPADPNQPAAGTQPAAVIPDAPAVIPAQPVPPVAS